VKEKSFGEAQNSLFLSLFPSFFEKLLKKLPKHLVSIKKGRTFALAFGKQPR
jgi:hypothetical protein